MTIASLLLQIATATDTASKIAQTAQAAPQEDSLSLLDLVMKGGYIMIPIGILSLITFYVFFERFFAIRKAASFDDNFFLQIKEMVYNGNIDAAKNICRATSNPASNMLLKGINRLGKPLRDIETAMEASGRLEISKLEKNTSTLGIIAGIAPMFGFIGTISGVIKIFYNISLADNISIGLISGGLYEKMITSAAGLVVGVLAFVGYHLLSMMIDKLSFRLETTAMQYLDALNEAK
jgi:biopolymer transport protein ExbB